MDLRIRDRVAAVAASSKGLGRGTALALARAGCRVVLCARREDALRSAENEVADAAGGADRVTAIALDVVAEPEALIDAAVQRFGSLHILVPNAGGPPPGGALDVDAAAYRGAFEANAVASIRMSQAAVPHMRAAGWGRICFITSSSVKQPLAGLALSNTARAGLAAFAKTLATEVAGEGITVNSVLPGTHDTDRIRSLGADVGSALTSEIPAGRLGSAEDFGDAVAFLCSDQANFITGTTLLVDGGRFPGVL